MSVQKLSIKNVWDSLGRKKIGQEAEGKRKGPSTKGLCQGHIF